MSNWDKSIEDDPMWIPSRPNTSGGDRYNKNKRKENASPHQSHRHYSHSSYNNHNHRSNQYNNNNYSATSYNNDHSKRVIIAKKKNHASNTDINDSFINSNTLDAKRQRAQQRYLMEQQSNSKEAKLADYKHKQQRYSQIKNEFGLSNSNKNCGSPNHKYRHTQTRMMNEAMHNSHHMDHTRRNASNGSKNKSKFKVLRRDNGGGTKLAILDLAGDMNDSELYAELDKKSKSHTPMKPIRPPIPTPHSSQSLKLSTPTSSTHSQPQSQSGSVPIRPIVTQPIPKTQEVAITSPPAVTLPTVQPKVVPLDSEEVEESQRNKRRKQAEQMEDHTERAAPQFKGGFVPHGGGSSDKYEYETMKGEEEEESVKKIVNDVRQLEVNNNYKYKESNRRENKNKSNRNNRGNRNTRNDNTRSSNTRSNNTRGNHNNSRDYRYESKDRYNNRRHGYNENNSKRPYQSRRNQSNSDRYYAQSGSSEYYNDDSGYNDYYQTSHKNEDYYGRNRNSNSNRSSRYTHNNNNNNNDNYNKSYGNNDSRYYHARSNRKY